MRLETLYINSSGTSVPEWYSGMYGYIPCEMYGLAVHDSGLYILL